MTPLLMNNQTFFFTVSHITKAGNGDLVYSIALNNLIYYLSKTPGINNCEQLDGNPPPDAEVMDEICIILSEIENEHKKGFSLPSINRQIFAIQGEMRALNFNVIR